MPGDSEDVVKSMFPTLYVASVGGEAGGLTVNVAADFVEAKVLGVDEPVFDEGEEKEIIPKWRWLRGPMEKLGIPIPSMILPGVHEDGTIDFEY